MVALLRVGRGRAVSVERATNEELLPPTPAIAARLSGVEWMMNLPPPPKKRGGNIWQQIFRARYDESSRRIIVRRMLKSHLPIMLP